MPETAKPLQVTATQFCKAKGHRWERSAGFLYYAREKYGRHHRMTVDEWTAVWDAWWQQPAEQPISK